MTERHASHWSIYRDACAGAFPRRPSVPPARRRPPSARPDRRLRQVHLEAAAQRFGAILGSRVGGEGNGRHPLDRRRRSDRRTRSMSSNPLICGMPRSASSTSGFVLAPSSRGPAAPNRRCATVAPVASRTSRTSARASRSSSTASTRTPCKLRHGNRTGRLAASRGDRCPFAPDLPLITGSSIRNVEPFRPVAGGEIVRPGARPDAG